MLFTTQKVEDLKINPFEGLMRMNSIEVMDLQKRKIIATIENVGRSPSFNINESPWLCDERQFLYSITNDNKIVSQNKNLTPVNLDSTGIYVYDLSTNQKKLLVTGGSYAVCSPVNPEIAFKRDQSVWIMNMHSHIKKLIYKGKSEEKVTDIHWTPDGNYIYIASYNSSLDPTSSTEKLINVVTQEEISFRKIGQGFNIYTWK